MSQVMLVVCVDCAFDQPEQSVVSSMTRDQTNVIVSFFSILPTLAPAFVVLTESGNMIGVLTDAAPSFVDVNENEAASAPVTSARDAQQAMATTVRRLMARPPRHMTWR